ncbi:MAG TPA: HDOD domain-containing protein [Phycisphaerae bacterium]|mgnify:CR=1 FL=1|nr:HDOD domain-containing protein [Phycisphaerae bacterium]HRR87440.1 HDOD domain-containing protein [Phycisphaerae bacterium]
MTAAWMSKPAEGHVAKPAQVELVLSQVDSLPTLPAVATRLLEVTTSEASSARQVIELVESDQGLSARLLSMVSKASVGTPVNTVERAVVLLGFHAVRSLVLSIQVFETFSQRIEESVTRADHAGFWKHSLATACAAKMLAEKAPCLSGPTLVNPEEAFVCGLLHDIGKVVLNACFAKSYKRVLAKVEATRGCIADVEREVFGLDHTAAGCRLAAHWKLPEMIRECIWLHHQTPASTPTRIRFPEHVRQVQVANRLAREMRIGFSGNYGPDRPLAAVAESAGFDKAVLDKVCADLPELIEARAELIGLNRLTSRDVYYEALAKANAELARVNLSLSTANRRLEQRSRCFEALRKLTEELGHEPGHEAICRAAAGVTEMVTDCRPAAVFAVSPGRSVVIIATSNGGEGGPQVEILPIAALGDVSAVSGGGEGWQNATAVPGPLLDRLRHSFGSSPGWYWPIRHQDGFLGAIVIGTQRPVDLDESMSALGDALGAWLAGAESRVLSRQLNEELADLNRRLVNSQEELARARSLAMVGEMAAGAAHELNNPLAVISGRAQMLHQAEVDEETRRVALLIAEHAHRASAIVSELMQFAKPTPPRIADFSIAGLLGQLRREWLEKTSLTESQFRLELSDGLPPIHADASQIKTLFDELIRNAVDALRDTPEPRLFINCRGDMTDDRLVVAVEDNGCGMTPEVLEHATDPFFSRRPAGRGRGLGLSRAVRYAEINGGRIRLTSTAGQGTVVLVELPVAAG